MAQFGGKLLSLSIIGLIITFYILLYGLFVKSPQIAACGVVGMTISVILGPISVIILGGEVHNG